jgi:hypothetical protein
MDHTDNRRVGAAAGCTQCNEWRTRRSELGTGRMEVIDDELWAIGLVDREISNRS